MKPFTKNIIDSEKYKEKKEKNKVRKRVKREQKKLKLEPLQTPSTSPQTTIARYLVNQVCPNAGQLDKDT